MKNKILEFIKDCIIILVVMLSGFWIIVTGLYILPQLAKNIPKNSLIPLFYILGTLCFSTIIIYKGLKYVFSLVNKK